MPSLLTARPRARPRPPRALPLRGALATDARFIVGAKGTQAAPDQVAYLTVDPSGRVSLDTADVVPDGFGVSWSFEDDGTIRIPVGRAPMELDVTAVRQALRPGTLLSESLRIIRRDRRVVADVDGVTTILCSDEGRIACARAALWTETMVCREAFSTGRHVRFADDVLTLSMFRLDGVVSRSALQILTTKTEKRYAQASTRLLGVLPWLEAQVAPPPAKQRPRART
jgi:hypothetical protein